MQKLRVKHLNAINNTSLDFVRDYINEFPWGNVRLMGIKGSRGVGKTTLLLQYIKRNFGNSEKALYVSLDDLYFSEIVYLPFFIKSVMKSHLKWSGALENAGFDHS